MAMTDERNAARANGERGKAVDAAILAIEKQFGRGSIMKLGSHERQQTKWAFLGFGGVALIYLGTIVAEIPLPPWETRDPRWFLLDTTLMRLAWPSDRGRMRASFSPASAESPSTA